MPTRLRTAPLDVGMADIVAKRKADFIGKRSLTLAFATSPEREQLVGLISLEGALQVGGRALSPGYSKLPCLTEAYEREGACRGERSPVDRYKEIGRLLAAARGVREITRALQCSRRLVRQTDPRRPARLARSAQERRRSAVDGSDQLGRAHCLYNRHRLHNVLDYVSPLNFVKGSQPTNLST